MTFLIVFGILVGVGLIFGGIIGAVCEDIVPFFVFVAAFTFVGLLVGGLAQAEEHDSIAHAKHVRATCNDIGGVTQTLDDLNYCVFNGKIVAS